MARLREKEKEDVLNNTRQQLLEAAAAEFASQGYVGANINRISLTAGFAKGTIYNYFPSKRALMLALIDEIAANHIDFIQSQVEPEADAAGRLQRFFRAGFAFVEQHPTHFPVIINAIYGPNNEFKERVYQAYEELFTMLIEGIVAAGVAQGRFRQVDADLAAALLMTIYLGSCSQLDAAGKIWLDPDQVAAFVLDGLRLPGIR